MDSMYLDIRAHATEVSLPAAKTAKLAGEREPDSETRPVVAERHGHRGEIAQPSAGAVRIRASWAQESSE